jgi:uridine kinase
MCAQKGGERRCFVVMSFDRDFDLVYERGIKRAIEDEGLTCIRMDDDALPKNIPTRIVRELIEADLVIADLTDSSPNVYYELGIAHTLGNKTIIISQQLDRLPFDVRSESTLGYGNSREGVKLLYFELRNIIKQLLAHPHEPSNIVQLAGRDYFDLQGLIRENLKELIAEKERLIEFRNYLKDSVADNSGVIMRLASDALQRARSGGQPAFVGLSGGAGLGKTRLAIELAESLRGHGVSVDILPMDAFMMDRASRLIQNISGYDPAANDLDGATSAIRALRGGGDIEIRPFNHRTGEHDPVTRSVVPSDIVILDGIHSLHPKLLPFLALKIFLYAPAPIAKELRFLSDVFERNYTAHKAFEHADEEYRKFEEFLLQYVKFADQVVEVEGYWRYSI